MPAAAVFAAGILTRSFIPTTEPILPLQMHTADPFAFMPEGRGSGRHDREPRFMAAPASSAAPLKSLADFERRLRPGVNVVLDWFDQLGQVKLRTRGTVERVREPRDPYFRVRAHDSDDNGNRRGLGVRYPGSRGECELAGATVTVVDGWGESRERPVWRLTILDESSAGPLIEHKSAPRQRSPRPDEESFAHMDQRLKALTGRRRPFRWWTPPGGGPLFCWTTQPAATPGRHLSFVAVQVGRGSRHGQSSSYRLVEDSVVRTTHRNAIKLAKETLARYNAGERQPWR